MSQPSPLDVIYPLLLNLQAHIKESLGRQPFSLAAVTPRDHALTASASQLGHTGEPALAEAWLAVVEIGLSDSLVTLVVLADGTARLDFDGRGGMVGPDAAPGIADAIQRFFEVAVSSLAALAPVRAGMPQPGPGRVTFAVRTPQGILGREAGASELAAGGDRLSALYQACMAVLAVIRGDVE